MTADPTVVLVPGGLYEDMDGHRFWTVPGVTGGLQKADLAPVVVDRPVHPRSWREESEALAAIIEANAGGPIHIVAGSNGCSAAARVAIDRPALVSRLDLCWPATAGDARVDAMQRIAIVAAADNATADRLLSGETLRGVRDDELQTMQLPIRLVPADPPNAVHQHRTVDRLANLLAGAVVTRGFPEAPRPEFPNARSGFIDLIADVYC